MSIKNTWVPKVQVPKSYYSFNYDDWEKWVTYHWVIRHVLATGAREVLEIGVGSGVVAYCLRKNGIKLKTLDIDPTLEPDYVGSVTELPFTDGTFDAVACTEVLEHMPFEQSRRAIRELSRVTRGYAFVTVPHYALSFAALVRLPRLQLRELRLRLPFPRPLRPNNQHYWECGRPGYPISRLKRELIAAGFEIVSERRPPTNYSSCFFVLRKRNMAGQAFENDARSEQRP